MVAVGVLRRFTHFVRRGASAVIKGRGSCARIYRTLRFRTEFPTVSSVPVGRTKVLVSHASRIISGADSH